MASPAWGRVVRGCQISTMQVEDDVLMLRLFLGPARPSAQRPHRYRADAEAYKPLEGLPGVRTLHFRFLSEWS